MENIEKLRVKAQEAQSAYLNAEEKRKNDEVLPLLRKMMGKCFKYHNGYGSGERWWLYAKVIEIDEKDYQIRVVEFQRTSMEIIEIRLATKFSYNGELFFGERSGYYPITNSEYNRAKKVLGKFVKEKLSL